MTLKLTAQEQAAWEHIRTSYVDTGFTPSVRGLGELMDRGENRAHAYIKGLERKGFIVFNAMRSQYIPVEWRELAGEYMTGIDRTPKDWWKEHIPHEAVPAETDGEVAAAGGASR